MSYILFKECELPSAQATSPPGLNRTFWLLTRPLSTWTSGPGDGGLSLTSACCPKVQLTGTRGWCLAQAHDLCPFLNFPVPLHFGKSRDNCFPHHEHGTPVHYNLFGYGDFFFFWCMCGYLFGNINESLLQHSDVPAPWLLVTHCSYPKKGPWLVCYLLSSLFGDVNSLKGAPKALTQAQDSQNFVFFLLSSI